MKKLFVMCLICIATPVFATASLTIKKNPAPPPPPSKPVVPGHPGMYPPRPIHPPYVIYSYERVNSNSTPVQQPVQVINNTYNYYENSANENMSSNTAPKTKEQLEEEERQYLKEKYSDILRNKTMSNETMCKKMAACFSGADYNELDRVLNKVLLLNCNINKLR